MLFLCLFKIDLMHFIHGILSYFKKFLKARCEFKTHCFRYAYKRKSVYFAKIYSSFIWKSFLKLFPYFHWQFIINSTFYKFIFVNLKQIFNLFKKIFIFLYFFFKYLFNLLIQFIFYSKIKSIIATFWSRWSKFMKTSFIKVFPWTLPTTPFILFQLSSHLLNCR